MIAFLKVYIASLLLIYLILFSWIGGYQMGCYMLFFPLLMLVIMSHSFIELKMQERLCFKRCFFQEGSLLAKIASSTVLVTLFSLFISMIMTLSLVIIAIDFEKELWIYLLTFNMILMLLLYRWFQYILRNSVTEDYRRLLAREWSLDIATLFLLCFTMYIYYNGYEPLYLDSRLEVSMINASNMMHSECSFLEILLKLHKESDALFWWVVVHGSHSIEYGLLKLGIWVLFLLLNTLAILGINRFIMQVISITDRILQPKSSQRRGDV